MFKIKAGIALSLIPIATAIAQVESVANVLSDFDLLGSWSPDCAHDPNDAAQINSARTTYTISSPDKGKVVTVFRNHQDFVTIEGEINAAIRIGEDKIKITTKTVKEIHTNKLAPPPELNETETIFQKTGNYLLGVESIKNHSIATVEKGFAIIRDPKTGAEIDRRPVMGSRKCAK